MKYKISLLASKALKISGFYTFENWSIEQADRYFNLIMDEIEFVAQKPESGLEYNFVSKGYYRTNTKSHLIFYKIDKKNNIVEIIRILHQRMDIESD